MSRERERHLFMRSKRVGEKEKSLSEAVIRVLGK